MTERLAEFCENEHQRIKRFALKLRESDASTARDLLVIADLIAQLPKDAKPPLIKKLDADASPIMTLVLSGEKTGRELYEIGERSVKDSIESVGGERVSVNGRRTESHVLQPGDLVDVGQVRLRFHVGQRSTDRLPGAGGRETSLLSALEIGRAHV